MLVVTQIKGGMRMKVRAKKTTNFDELSVYLSVPKQLLHDCNSERVSNLIQPGETFNIPFLEEINCHISSTSNKESIRNIIDFYKSSIHSPDSPNFIQKHRAYDFNVLQEDLEKLLIAFPFVRQRTIGISVLGLPIIELLIGRGTRKVHMNGSFHANEWITTSVLMCWLNEYLQAVVNGESFQGHDAIELYDKTTLSFVPMVNPDGVQLVLNGLSPEHSHYQSVLAINNNSLDFEQWKANINGVDLNNQFPAYWEIEKERKIPKAPASRDYPGDAPLTEPESAAMANLANAEEFDLIVAVHTQGEEIYWGYMNCEPDESLAIVTEYSRLSGYKPIRNIDSHAGFRDWFIFEKKKCGFTIELGIGVNPLPLNQLEEIYEKSKGIFWASLYSLK